MSYADNILGLEGTNFGGARSMGVILVDDIQDFPFAYKHNISTDIKLHPEKSMYKVEFTQETQRFRTELKEKKGTDLYVTKVSGIVPKDRLIISTIIGGFHHGRVVLLIEDNNGFQRVVGTKKNPVQIRWKVDHKKKLAGRNEYTIEFEHVASHPPYYYKGAVPGVHTNHGDAPNGGHELSGAENFLGKYKACTDAGFLPILIEKNWAWDVDVVQAQKVTEVTADPEIEKIWYSINDGAVWQLLTVGDELPENTKVLFRGELNSNTTEEINWHYVADYI